MAGLMPSTVYYVRSYAINASGTAYGQERSFQTTAQASGPVTVPILGTQFVVKTDSNFIGGGNITSDGNSAITSLGICWNRTGMPTLSDSVIYFSTPGLGSFDLPFQLPSGCNENFFIRAFAINAVGVGYGQEVGTTNGYQVVFDQSSIENLGATNVVIKSRILLSGGCFITEKGICWSTSANPTISNVYFRQSCGSDTGIFLCSANNLIPERQYYARPYAITANGIYYGQNIGFFTDTTSSLHIGKYYAGGIIFYLDSTMQHGIVSAPIDQGSAIWGCEGDISNTNVNIGSGSFNTAVMVASCNTPGTAARICNDLVLNGYSDWFLPSFNELFLMWSNLHINGLGSFNLAWPSEYWSSSASASWAAYNLSFYSGTPCGNGDGCHWRGGHKFVRAARYF
jgi:hypothetical protein